MKKTLFLSAIICVMLHCVQHSVCVFAEEKLNVAVAELEGHNVSAMESATITDFIRTELVNAGIYTVLERSNMHKILAEQRFQQTGCTTTECAIEMGKILNVQEMFIGSFSKLMNVYFVNVRLVNVETGSISLAETVQCESEKELYNVVKELVAKIVSKVAPSEEKRPEIRPKPELYGRPSILEVKGKNGVINRGALDRVKVRDIYDVFDARGLRKIAYLRITQVGPEQSSGKIIKFTQGETLKPGLPIVWYAKRKVGGIGATLGITNGDLGTGGGGGLYFDYVHLSGFGFQINLGAWYISKYRHEYQYDPMSGSSSIRETRDVLYASPYILKYHLNYDSSISPYAGLGWAGAYLSYSRYESYSTGPPSYSYWSDDKSDDKEDKAVILNLGVDFFANRLAHLTFDWKRFLGREWYGYDTSVNTFSIGLSINW